MYDIMLFKWVTGRTLTALSVLSCFITPQRDKGSGKTIVIYTVQNTQFQGKNSTTKYGIFSSVLINYHAEDNSQLNYRFLIEFFSIDLWVNKGRNYVIFTSWAMTQHNQDDSCWCNVTIVISSVALSLLISSIINCWLYLDAFAKL